jgi:transcription-repair coupling factor
MTRNTKQTLEYALQELVQRAKKEDNVQLSQLGNRSGQSAVLAELFTQLPGNTVWITRDEKEARAFEALLKFWCKDKPLDLYRLTDPPEPRLYAAIQEKKKIAVLMPLELLRSAFPDRSSYDKTVEHLEVGERRSPIELSQRLIQHGYTFEEAADTPGTIARRGSIVDVHPVHDGDILRIEFVDNAIDSITKISNKKKASSLHSLIIPPARLGKGSVSFWSIWPEKPTLVYEDPEGDDNTMWKDLQQRDGFKRLIIYPFKTTSAEALGVHAAPLYQNDLSGAAVALHEKKKEGWNIHFLDTSGDEKLAHFISQKLKWGLAPERVPELMEGFVVELSHELFITDKEVFGRHALRQEEKNILDQAFLSNLEEGDFVVHADHGVGKFAGMKNNTIDGVTHEYFLLEYAEQDKLYVPVENADKLTKYLGTEQPKIHRLSGSSWKSVTQKIKEEARILAKDLLQLYAERTVAEAPTSGAETDEERRLKLSFPYNETLDQQKAIDDITSDLQRPKPMDRLICGDVGFGKTEVAIRAAFKVMMNGFQVALLTPTTILTQQHYDTFKERLKDFNVRIAILSRFETKAEQDQVIREIQTGDVDIVVGTHRLLSNDVKFKRLGLVVIDEEQRFGVKHKEQLKKLRKEIHVLTLTATPIPRTLNIALSSIRDISLIETPPEGRLPIETIIEPYGDLLVREAIKKEFARKGQVYYLYNKVETIELAAKRLKKIVPEARIGIAHGQLDEESLAKVMSEFDNGKTNILVCSTIIENGLDLPNVNTIIVENATKFGLAQLYQLRGRVGRGLRQAYAFFLYGSHKLTGNAKKRLQSLLEARELGSGFQLALRDLEIRGVGNILGKEQHGKVSAVGLALYSRLLAQAVDEIKTGKKHEEFRDILIDLPLSIGIPHTYIPKESSRLQLYQKIAGLTRIAQLNEAYGNMMEPYGKPPQEVKNLFALLKLRIAAQDTDISRIETKKSPQGERLFITLSPSINPKMIPDLLNINEAWTFSQDQIRVLVSKLGDDWFSDLEKIIVLARNHRLEEHAAQKNATVPETKS